MNFFICHLFLFLLRYIKPQKLPKTGQVGIATLIGHKHTHMFICSTNSFFYHLHQKLPCTIIDDGTLNSSDIRALLHYFPNIHIIQHAQANRAIEKILVGHKHIRQYRRLVFNDKFNLKLTDPFLLTSYEKIIYMDCDVLFFNTPNAVLSWIARGTHPLYAPEKSSNPAQAEPDEWRIVNNMFREHVNPSIDSLFNSGFLCIQRSQYNLDFVDKVLQYIHHINLDTTWTSEQYTLSAVWAKNKAIVLEKTYRHIVRPTDDSLDHTSDYVFIHFAYLAKSQFIPYAIRRMWQTHFFLKNN